MSGVVSVLGPLIGTTVMQRFAIDGVFYFMAAAVLLLALVAGVRSVMVRSPEHLQAPFDILTPQAGPLAHRMGLCDLLGRRRSGFRLESSKPSWIMRTSSFLAICSKVTVCAGLKNTLAVVPSPDDSLAM